MMIVAAVMFALFVGGIQGQNKSQKTGHGKGAYIRKYGCKDTSSFYLQFWNGEQTTVMCPPASPTCDYTLGECVQTASFVCPGADGFYPSLSRCNRFYECVNGLSMELKCPGLMNYDPIRRRCLYIPCRRALCKGKKDCYVRYPDDPSVYVYCDKTSRPTNMLACPAGFVFNELKQECVFDCRGVGYCLDPQDVSTYFVCKWQPCKFTMYTRSCSPGVFSLTKRKCTYDAMSRYSNFTELDVYKKESLAIMNRAGVREDDYGSCYGDDCTEDEEDFTLDNLEVFTDPSGKPIHNPFHVEHETQ